MPRNPAFHALQTLTAQALPLDAIFGEFIRRPALDINNHLEAAERYMRLDLKAQANSRATMEAHAKLHQPREQTVQHVHVGDGGRAIVAGAVNYLGGLEMPNRANSPMQQPKKLAEAARCLAKTRNGGVRQSPAAKSRKECRMHGGTNPGPPRGNHNAWTHGTRLRQAREIDRILRKMAHPSRLWNRSREALRRNYSLLHLLLPRRTAPNRVWPRTA